MKRVLHEVQLAVPIGIITRPNIVQRTVPKASILASTLCIEDARSLVLRLDLPSASQRNFNQLDPSCLAVKVPLRGTFVLLCVDQAARTYGPLAWSFEQIASSKHFCVSGAIAEQIIALL